MKKIAATLVLASALGALCVGCAPVTVNVPPGSKLVFKNASEAEEFRKATLIDPEHLGNVVNLKDGIQVVAPTR